MSQCLKHPPKKDFCVTTTKQRELKKLMREYILNKL